MVLKNITLAVIFITLLITRSVESAGEKGSGLYFASPQQGGRFLPPKELQERLASESEKPSKPKPSKPKSLASKPSGGVMGSTRVSSLMKKFEGPTGATGGVITPLTLKSTGPRVQPPSKSPPAKQLQVKPPPTSVIVTPEPSATKSRPIPRPPPFPKPSSVPKSRPIPGPPPFPKPPAKASQIPVNVEDPIASTHEGMAFRGAMRNGDPWTAHYLFWKGNDALKKYCASYFIDLGSSELVKLINNTNDYDIKRWVLHMLLVYADQPFINKVFRELNLSNDSLRQVAGSAYLACMPHGFISLLEKIDDENAQKEAVERGVVELFDKGKAKECLDFFITALEIGDFKNKDLANIAIRAAFFAASYTPDKWGSYAMPFYNHPAITAGSYSAALRNSYGTKTKELFNWLLERANEHDLMEVIADDDYEYTPLEYQTVVEKALKDVNTRRGGGLTQIRDVRL